MGKVQLTYNFIEFEKKVNKQDWEFNNKIPLQHEVEHIQCQEGKSSNARLKLAFYSITIN